MFRGLGDRSGPHDFLVLGRSAAVGIEPLAEDDDSAGGTDARITYDLPADGTYLVFVNTAYPGEIGAYTATPGGRQRIDRHGSRGGIGAT